jgi:hypothetical protein
MRSLCLAALLATTALPALAADPAPVPYPTGYRDWVHVKSMTIEAGHPLYGAFGGVHHIYANPKALAGYKSGQFADGAVIVFDLREAQRANNAITDGPRKVVGVMHKDSKKWAATGGWGFEGFKGDSKTDRAVGAEAASACFNCHAPQKESGYVFSTFQQ